MTRPETDTNAASERGSRGIEGAFRGEVTLPVQCRFLLFLPEGYESQRSQRYPLLLFLHGSGQRGDDLALVREHGPYRVTEPGRGRDFILVAPQCPHGQRWSTLTLIALLDHIEQQYRVDSSREYVTGLSMGGHATWRLGCEYPQRFAAIAPVCGKDHPDQAYRLASVPVWVFHGAKDEVIPISESEMMVRALKEVGADVRFTVYPEAGHDAWTETYENDELYDWLLSHRRAEYGSADRAATLRLE